MLASQGDQIAAEGRHLAAALSRLTATCHEYPLGGIAALGDRVQPLGRRDAEIAGWLRGVAEAFVAADSASAPPPPGPAPAPLSLRHLAVDISVEIIDSAAWNTAARRLLGCLRFINTTAALSGDHLWGAGAGADFVKAQLTASLLAIGGLIMLEDGPRWPAESVDSPDDMLKLLEQGFWNLAFHRVAPDLLLALAGEIEGLNRRTCADLGACVKPRPAKLDEAKLTPQQLFRGAKADPATGELTLPAWSMMTKDDEHSAISSYQGEQISLFRIGRDEYLFAICGLDLLNMSASPNGLAAVIQTATEPDPMANPYYRLIRARFLTYLGRIPPGSTLNMSGHSMGGGMTMLLLNDPEVQAALASGGYTLRSVVLYGAVRPLDPAHNGIPPGRPSDLSRTILAGTEVRVYVDREDKLALNVGAGHMADVDRPLPNVHLIDNGELSSATEAHTSYWSPEKYADLPVELQDLPFHVDPRYWELSRSPDTGDVRLDMWLDGVGLVGPPQTPPAA